jgi:serine phosphatase RsbU (regulator of sigma subunit)
MYFRGSPSCMILATKSKSFLSLMKVMLVCHFLCYSLAMPAQKKNKKYIDSLTFEKLSAEAKAYLEGYSFERFLDINKKSNEFARAIKNVNLEISSLVQLGNGYSSIKQYHRAVSYLMQASEIAKKNGLKRKLVNIVSNLGVAYFHMGKFAEAKSFFLEGNKFSYYITDEATRKESINNNILNIGAIFGSMAEKEKRVELYDSAQAYFLKSLHHYIEGKDIEGQGYVYNNIALIFRANNKLDSTLKYLEKAYHLKNKSDDLGIVFDGIIAYFEISSLLKKFEVCEELFARLKTLENKITTPELRIILLNTYDSYYTNKKDFKNMVKLKDSIIKLQNEINQKVRDDELRISQMVYSAQNKLVSDSLTYQNQIKRQMEVSDRKTLIGVFLFIIAMCIGFALILNYKRYKTTLKQKIKIDEQSKIIQEKQKEILDSIQYAKLIQESLMISKTSLKKYFSDFLLNYQPRDIVAGDFYWGQFVGDVLYYIIADCTGHGVPGAFMSILSIKTLKEKISTKSLLEPNEILNSVREDLINILNPPDSEEARKDGMDCILLKINLNEKRISYAGAQLSFYRLREGKTEEFKTDKMPVGRYSGFELPFQNFELELQKDDRFYFYTDGYIDQFGGANELHQHGKKFKRYRLLDLIKEHSGKSFDEQEQIFDSQIKSWRGNMEQTDDITLCAFKI